MKGLNRIFLFLTAGILLLTACQTIELYEKTARIPGHSWKSDFTPSFTFTIRDTSVPYQLFFIIRHSDRYHFNNIYIDLSTRQPGSDSVQTGRYDLRLGTDSEGWLGSGMDDIYEHRVPLTPVGGRFFFKKPGDYTFTLKQIMREDPLQQVLNVGLRIEKKP